MHRAYLSATAYNYSNIDTPVYLFWSKNDWLTSTGDIQNIILPTLREGVVKVSFELYLVGLQKGLRREKEEENCISGR